MTRVTIENPQRVPPYEAGLAPPPEMDPPEMRDPKVKLSKREEEALLKKVEDWWIMTREAHAESRVQMRIDEDFYDHIQWTEEETRILLERNQAPLVFNKVKQAIDWVIGTERRARVDWTIYPRAEDDVESASAKTSVMKYISDASRAGFERSLQFQDAVKVGVGWIEEGVRADADEEPIFIRHESWHNIWTDPFGKRHDLDDHRFLFRSKWLDLDVAKAIVDKAHHRALDEAAQSSLYPDLEAPDDDVELPAIFMDMDSYGRPRRRHQHTALVGGSKHGRKRVRLIECWFRKPVRQQRIWSRDSFSGEVYNPDDPDEYMQQELDQGVATLTDAITFKMCMCLFIEGRILAYAEQPYRHNRFPFTPCWAYRRGRDNMPYGLIRGVRDAQMDFNKRMSKALYILSTRQTLYEDGAIEDIDEWAENIANPAGMLRARAGALSQGRIEIMQNTDIASGHITLLERDMEHIYDGAGVTRDNLGYQTNARTGKAIQSRQQEGALTTAPLFDNFRLAIQLSGEKTLSLIEQFMVATRQIRITGDSKVNPYIFLPVNQPVWEDGRWRYKNDLTASKADFVVDTQDFRESMRVAMAEQLMTMIGQLPPELGMQLLDLPIDLMDVPQKHDIVKRIRNMIGIPDPNMDPNSEEGIAFAQQQAEQAEAQAREQALSEAERSAKIRQSSTRADRDEATVAEALARTRKTAFETEAAAAFLREGGSLSEYLHEE